MKKINEILDQISSLRTAEIIKTAYDAYTPGKVDGYAFWDIEEGKLVSRSLFNQNINIPEYIKLYMIPAVLDIEYKDMLDEQDLEKYTTGEYDTIKAYFMATQGMSSEKADEELEYRELNALFENYIEDDYPDWDDIETQITEYLNQSKDNKTNDKMIQYRDDKTEKLLENDIKKLTEFVAPYNGIGKEEFLIQTMYDKFPMLDFHGCEQMREITNNGRILNLLICPPLREYEIYMTFLERKNENIIYFTSYSTPRV